MGNQLLIKPNLPTKQPLVMPSTIIPAMPPHNTTQSHNRSVSQTSLKSDFSNTSGISSENIKFLVSLLSTEKEPVHSVVYRDYQDLAYGDDPTHLVSYVLSSSAMT